MKKTTRIIRFLFGICGISGINFLLANPITIPQTGPYSSDPNTVLLEHFDGSTTGSPFGSIQYVSGVFGQGVHLNDTSYIGWAFGAFQNGTVEFWGKLDSLLNGADAPTFIWAYISPIYLGQGPGNTFKINVANGMPGGGFHLAPFNAIGSPANTVRIEPNTWHHYALTWGSAGLHFYVDGVLLGTGPTGQPWSPTSYWVVGNKNGLGFNGTMDELRISDIQRTFDKAVVPEGGGTAVFLAFGLIGLLKLQTRWRAVYVR